MAEPEKLDTLQAVELAEGIEIRLRMAGPVLRVGAYVIDLLIRAAVLVIGGIAASFAGIAIGGKVVGGVMLLAWFLMDWLYPVVFEAGKRGATPGKRMMGLRVVQTTGSPITLGQAIVRNFLRFIDGMPAFTYCFGLTSCLATQAVPAPRRSGGGHGGDLRPDPADAGDRLAAADGGGAAAGGADGQ